jgi:hypothetical protein
VEKKKKAMTRFRMGETLLEFEYSPCKGLLIPFMKIAFPCTKLIQIKEGKR